MGCGGSSSDSSARKNRETPISGIVISTQTDAEEINSKAGAQRSFRSEPLPADQALTTLPPPAEEGTASTSLGSCPFNHVLEPISRMVVVSSRRWKEDVSSKQGYPSQVDLFEQWSTKLWGSEARNGGGFQLALKSVSDLLLKLPPPPRQEPPLQSEAVEENQGSEADDPPVNPLLVKKDKAPNGPEGDDEEEEVDVKVAPREVTACPVVEASQSLSSENAVPQYLWIDDAHADTLGIIALEYTPPRVVRGGGGLSEGALLWATVHALEDLLVDTFQVMSIAELEADHDVAISSASPQKLQQKQGTPAKQRLSHSGLRSPLFSPVTSPTQPATAAVTSFVNHTTPQRRGSSRASSVVVTGRSASKDSAETDVDEQSDLKHQQHSEAEAAQWKLIDTMWSPAFREERLTLMEQHLSSATTTKKSSKISSSQASCEGWCNLDLSLVPSQLCQEPPKVADTLTAEGEIAAAVDKVNAEGTGGPSGTLAFYFTPSVVLPMNIQEEIIRKAGVLDRGQPMDRLVGECHQLWSVALEFLSVNVLDNSSNAEDETVGSPKGAVTTSPTAPLKRSGVWNPSTEVFEVVLSFAELQAMVNSSGGDQNLAGACIRGEHRWSMDSLEGDSTTASSLFQSSSYSWVVQVGLVLVPGTVVAKDGTNSGLDDTGGSNPSSRTLPYARMVDPVEKAELTSLERIIASVLVPGISAEEAQTIRKRLKESRRQLRRSTRNSVAGLSSTLASQDESKRHKDTGLPEELKINKHFPEFAGRIKLVQPHGEEAHREEKKLLTAARLSRCPVLTPCTQYLRVRVQFVGAASDGFFPIPDALSSRLNVQDKFIVNFCYRFHCVRAAPTCEKPTSTWKQLALAAEPTTEEFGFISKVSKTVYRSYVGHLSFGSAGPSGDVGCSTGSAQELIEDGLLEYHYSIRTSPHTGEDYNVSNNVDDGQSGSVLGFVSNSGDESSAFDLQTQESRSSKALYLMGAAYPDVQIQLINEG